MYLAWVNSLPLSDTIWRYEANEKRAAEDGHSGDCTKQPWRCALCLLNECLEAGRQMAKAWEVEAAKDSDAPVN